LRLAGIPPWLAIPRASGDWIPASREVLGGCVKEVHAKGSC
jgi:hypothetical protein